MYSPFLSLPTRPFLRLQRHLFPGPLFATHLCCLQSTTLNSWRGVYGGQGRGDLLYAKNDAQRLSKRALGPLRGLRRSSQATMPESGQLHYRKLMFHAMGEGPGPNYSQYRHETCTWAYIIPSLIRCAEQALSEEFWERLCRLEVENADGKGDALTKVEFECVRNSQSLFRYELHQRLPLLEDSVLSADLHQMINWFRAAHRAWVRLPVTLSSSHTCHAGDPVGFPQPTEASHHSSFTTMSRSNVAVVLRDVTPGRHQICDLAPRVAQLTDVVVDRIRDELARLSEGNSSGERGKLKSARLLDKEEKARQSFAGELQWHRISQSLPLQPRITGGK